MAVEKARFSRAFFVCRMAEISTDRHNITAPIWSSQIETRSNVEIPMLAASLIGFAISVLLAVIANRQFREFERLPMQWGMSGQVNWTAPRVLVLAFIPALYTLLASVLIWAARYDLAKYTAKSVGTVLVVLIAAQILHLWMLDRHRLNQLK